MRKIFAVVLTVLMLASVLAAFPVSAAATDNSSKLIITEFGAEMNATGASGAGVLHYMEILNTSGEMINITDYAIARATDYTRKPKPADGDVHCVSTTDENSQTWLKYKFLAKINIVMGEIVDETPYVDKGLLAEGTVNHPDHGGLKLVNTNDAEIANGETAIIWFIGQETMAWLQSVKSGISVEKYNPIDCFLEQFYPGEENAELRTKLASRVFMVWAYDNEDPFLSTNTDRKVATDTFKVEVPQIAARAEAKSYVYGVVDADWDLGTVAYSITGGFNEGLYTYIRHGAQLNENYTGKTNCADNSASYIPAQYDPFLFKAKEAFNGASETEIATYTDYYTAGLTGSYLECALVDMGKGYTPGTLTDWQWSYIDATQISAGKTAEAVRTEFVDLFGYNDDDTLADGGRNEPTIEVNPPSKEDLINRYFPADGGKKDKEGLPLGALIAIIAGGSVLVLGGAFVAVFFLVIKPKKAAAKAAAMAAYAEEEAAPAEEAPAEEAPAEETNE